MILILALATVLSAALGLAFTVASGALVDSEIFATLVIAAVFWTE
jgi:hypothetical protein